jgi:hypothetical protein
MRTVLASVALLVGLAGTVTGCTPEDPAPARSAPSNASTSSASAARQVPAAALDASVTQFRYQEGTRNLKAGVTNNSARDIRVSSATIAWDGLAFPAVRLTDDPVHPGQTAAFQIAYGAPACTGEPSTRPTLVTVVDGRRRRLPLRVEDPGLLDRLRDKACARGELAAVAGVALTFGRRTLVSRGEEYLPGRVVITRRGGRPTAVRVEDLGGSVLVDLVPAGGRGALPATLRPAQQRLVVPVLAGSAHRCDDHARGQSSQSFLLSVFVGLAGRPLQRQIVIPPVAVQDRLLGVIDRDCR